MNVNNTKNQEQLNVISVGNAWVVCNSKSRPGFKYYFNTFSGQAVWNLNPDEIEKAKKFTKGLPISEIEKCPEPSMDPPMDLNRHPSNDGTSQTYNDPFIRRQIPNQTPNMYPMGLLSLNSLPGVPNIAGMNPLIWNNDNNNVALAQAPVIYVAYPQPNFQQQEFPPFFPTHVNGNQDNHSQTFINSRDKDTFNRNRMNDVMGQTRFVQGNMQQINNNNSKPDLRHKLIRKRSKSVSSESAQTYGREQESSDYRDIQANNKKQTIKNTCTETPSKYDLSVLDQLKSPHSSASGWYILVDTDIILSNFPLLGKITDPEQDCHLMVPHHVMKELHQLACNGDDVQTRRIVRFLSLEIESGRALKGEDMSRGADDDNTYKMLATCDDLAGEHNVILLSNDAKYQSYIDNYNNIHILTWDELKRILDNNGQAGQTPIRNKSPTLAIKIVVPNNTHVDKNAQIEQWSKTSDHEIRSPAKKKVITLSRPFLSRSISNIDTPTQSMLNKYAPKLVLDNTDEVDHASKETPFAVIEKRYQSQHFNNDEKQKEIKSSCSSNCETNAEGTEKRQYRWRKKRVSCSKTTANSLSMTSDQAITDPTKHQEALVGILPVSSVRPLSQNLIPRSQTPSISRSSISSQKDRRPNVIVEETSTSGVISNTTLDSDSVVSRVELKKTVSVCDDVNFELFAVAGAGMEEVLRTRREEWVLRFNQIMEETLKEILRVDSTFQSKGYKYTPTWTADLPELARSVIKKFSDHFNVVDAANRFSFKLQKINDSEGANIEPKQYMDMYSFGVYLINSLKNVTEDCEDLNAADESLKKLLFDIQNANMEIGHNDTFTDEPTESVANAAQLTDLENGMSRKFPNSAQDAQTGTNRKGKMPKRRIESQTLHNKQLQQQNITNAKKFFSSLALIKKTDRDNPSVTLDVQNTDSTNTNNKLHAPPQAPSSPRIPHSPSNPKVNTAPQSPRSPRISHSPSNPIVNTPPQGPSSSRISHSPSKPKVNTIQDDPADNSKASNSELLPNSDKDDKRNPIKFVRNFNCIPQFEVLLNKKSQSAVSDEEPINEEYEEDNYENSVYTDKYNDQNGELYCEDGTEEVLLAPNDEDNLSEKSNTEKFEWFIKEFTNAIRGTIKLVLMLCIKFGGELKNSQEPSQGTKNELKKAYESISSIKNALDSVLDSQSTAPENNIIVLLKIANLEDCVPSKELLLEFRDILIKCSDQVNLCYDKVEQIMQLAAVHNLAS